MASAAARKALVFVVAAALLVVAEFGLYLFSKRNLSFHGVVPIRVTADAGEVYFTPGAGMPPYLDDLSIRGGLDATEAAFLRDETKETVAGASGDFDKILRLREWTRRQATRTGLEIDFAGSTDPVDILKFMRAGKSAACGPFTVLFSAVVRANGFPARQVILFKNPPFDDDGHAMVEVFVQGKWVVFDPMLNMYWTIGGRPVSAWELRTALFSSGQRSFEAVSGKMDVDPSIDNNYINIYTLFSNVLYQYELPRAVTRLARYPYGKLLQTNIVQLVEARQGSRVSPFRLNNFLVDLMYLWLPTLILALLSAGLFCVFAGRRSFEPIAGAKLKPVN